MKFLSYVLAVLLFPVVLSAQPLCPAPKIDGYFSTFEYSNADRHVVPVTLPDGTTVDGELYVYSNGSGLSLALRVQATSADLGTGLIVSYGYYDGGDIVYAWYSPAGRITRFSDEHHTSNGLVNDEVAGGTTDGEAAFTNNGSSMVLEMWHPFAGKDRYDYQGVMGQAIPLYITPFVMDERGGETQSAPVTPFMQAGGSCGFVVP